MLRFIELDLRDFGLFESLSIDFATDPSRPLTFIRGENESGKTTLLRAMMWVIFGVDAVPQAHVKSERFDPIRPIYAEPGKTVTSTGTLIIEHLDDDGKLLKKWRLTRRTSTTESDGNISRSAPEGIPATVETYVDGNWELEPAGVERLQNTFFRRNMRDFYFIDADKADRYVGGPEGQHDDALMRTTTTDAMKSMLGVNVLRGLMDRVETAGRAFNRAAANAAGDAVAEQIADEIDDAAKRRDEASADRDRLASQLADYEERLEAERTAQHGKDKQNEEYRRLTVEIERLTEELNRTEADLSSRLNAGVGKLHAGDIYYALAGPSIARVVEELGSLKQSGILPPAEAELLPRLLDGTTCVCGEPLNEDRRKNIRDRHEQSCQFFEEASALDRVRVAADAQIKQAIAFGNGASWQDAVEDHLIAADSIREERDELDGERHTLLVNRDSIPDTGSSHASVISMLSRQADRAKSELDQATQRYDDARSDLAGANKRLKALEKHAVRARRELAAKDVAEHIYDALAKALIVIERDRVEDVSTAMNAAFSRIADQGDESDAETGLTTAVGVEIADPEADIVEYEIFAKGPDGRPKPLAIVNGANRRATAVSFVLALSQISRQYPPFVADSLFHTTSGTVRRNLLEYILETSKQPILFGTRSDVRDEEADLAPAIRAKSGRSYTLTSTVQAAVVNDVAEMIAPSKSVIAVCTCDVTQACPACERKGDRSRGYEIRDKNALI